MPTTILPSFAKGEIAPQLTGRVDTAMYRVALAKARNAIIHIFGGVSNRPGTLFIGPVKDHTEPNVILVDFRFSTDDQYILEFGDQYMRVIRNDAHVVETAQNIENITQADPAVVTITGHGLSNGDEVFIKDVVGMTQVNNRRFTIQNVAANTFELVDQLTGTPLDSTGYTAYSSGGTVARVFTLTTPYVSADLRSLEFVQSADTMTITHPNYAPRDLTRVDHDVWNLDVIAFAPLQAAPTGVTVTPNTPGSTSYTYAVTAINDTTFEESLTATGSTATGTVTPDNVIDWTGAAGAGRYAVYRQVNGLFGFIGETEDVTFTDDNIEPDLSLQPPTARDPFSGAGNFPATSTYFEQRQVFGGSDNNPDTTYFSRTGSRRNFTVSRPLREDDAITAVLTSTQINRIRHMVPTEDLIVFTKGAEWRLDSGQDSAFSPLSIRQKPQSDWGVSKIAPKKLGGHILFVEEGDARVRALFFDLNSGAYTAEDITILATHLLAEEGPDEFIVKDWAVTNFPEPRIYIVRSDGQALTITYDPSQQVVAWTTFDTDGEYEAVAALRKSVNSVEDGVYWVVKRRINGVDVRFIERTQSRKFADVRDGFFLDAGASLDDPKPIAGIAESGDLVITTESPHGFVDGDVVEFDEIIWEPTFDEFGNEIQPDFLNNRRFTVVDATSLTFKLECDEVV